MGHEETGSPQPDRERTGQAQSGRQGDAAANVDDGPTAAGSPGVRAGRLSNAAVRTRSIVLWIVLAGLALTLVWLFTYRPPGPRFRAAAPESRSDTAVPGSAPPETARDVAVAPPAAGEGAHSEARTLMVAAAQSVDAVAEYWRLAAELLPVAEVELQGATEAAKQLRGVPVFLDSADRCLADAEHASEEIARLARAAGGQAAYRLSLVYVAVRDHLALLREESAERRSYFEATQASLDALLAGDEAERDVMRDVASSHLFRSEKRARSLDRSAERMRQSMSEALR